MKGLGNFAKKCSENHCFKNRTGPAGPTGSNRESGANPVRLKPSKSVNNRSKTGVEPEIEKKNGLMSGSIFKTMVKTVRERIKREKYNRSKSEY